MTMVLNLNSGVCQWYCLTWKEALVCAFMNSVGKRNTWEYDFSRKVSMSASQRTAALADWCVEVK